MLPKVREVQKVGRAVPRPAEPEPKRPGRDVIKEANCGRTARSVWSARSLLPLWRGPRRSKAPASRTHSIRFAKHVAAPSISIPHLQISHRKICAKITDFRIYVSSAPTNTPVSEQNCMFEPHRGALETARPTRVGFGQHALTSAPTVRERENTAEAQTPAPSAASTSHPLEPAAGSSKVNPPDCLCTPTDKTYRPESERRH